MSLNNVPSPDRQSVFSLFTPVNGFAEQPTAPEPAREANPVEAPAPLRSQKASFLKKPQIAEIAHPPMEKVALPTPISNADFSDFESLFDVPTRIDTPAPLAVPLHSTAEVGSWLDLPTPQADLSGPTLPTWEEVLTEPVEATLNIPEYPLYRPDELLTGFTPPAPIRTNEVPPHQPMVSATILNATRTDAELIVALQHENLNTVPLPDRQSENPPVQTHTSKVRLGLTVCALGILIAGSIGFVLKSKQTTPRSNVSSVSTPAVTGSDTVTDSNAVTGSNDVTPTEGQIFGDVIDDEFIVQPEASIFD